MRRTTVTVLENGHQADFTPTFGAALIRAGLIWRASDGVNLYGLSAFWDDLWDGAPVKPDRVAEILDGLLKLDAGGRRE